MTARALVSAVVLSLAASACGYSIRTATDYDRKVDFSSYRSFFMINGNSSGNSLMDQRVRDDVRSALTAKGWMEVPEGEGQTTVVVHAATRTKHTYRTFYDGWGGWHYRWAGPSSATTFVQDYKVGTLVVDIFDAMTKEAIWHGFARDVLSDNPRSNSKVNRAAIDKMFADFPTAWTGASGQ